MTVCIWLFISDKYNLWRENKGNLLRYPVPSNNEFPKGVQLSFPDKFFRGLIVNGVAWACERCARLRKMGHLSMSSGLSTFFHWSSVRDKGILVQGMEVYIGISRYLMPLDFLWWVQYLMWRCICCWCSIRIRLDKYV